MQIEIKRSEYFPNTTIGKLYINGEYICYTLEDAVRADGVKIHGATAIPTGEYGVKLSFSNRFKRLMPILFTRGINDWTIQNKGVTFMGVRIHGGNTHLNTHGCPLVAYNRVNKETIQGTAEAEVTKRIKKAIEQGEKVNLTVINL